MKPTTGSDLSDDLEVPESRERAGLSGLVFFADVCADRGLQAKLSFLLVLPHLEP